MAILHYKVNDGNKAEKICDFDRSLSCYLSEFREEDYGKILEADNRFEIFYHLSKIRQGILNWYPFDNTKSLLEIGGGYGALTGLFCSRCAKVTVTEKSKFRAECIAKRHSRHTHLKVYEGDPTEIDFGEKFDYIVWIGGLEWYRDGKRTKASYAEYVKKLMQSLKPDGKMLVAAENRYGVRYFCGDIEPHTGKCFDGIKGYPDGSTGYSFSKQELDDILRMAGFKERKFYYPMPDYEFPQLIYSQNCLPRTGLSERLRPFCHDRGKMIVSENALYDDLADNDVFPFFANSFLVECGTGGETCRVDYSAVTTDRIPLHACITSIYHDNSVWKSACFPEGEKNIQAICRNLDQLEKRGIRTVPYRLENNIMKMPYIEDDLLSVWVRKNIGNGALAVEKIFRRLYESILQSSDHADAGRNALLDAGNSSLPWGTILKKAYIEMIPLNCFYVDQEFVFFDQEFVKEYYPAKYVMFRALRNTYSFIPEMEEVIPLRKMKEDYGLNELWDLFWAEDDRFLEELRDMPGCRYYYKWLENGRSYMKKYKTGYIAGVFDLFHIGHLNLINRARERCEYLIVGVLTDELVLYYKKKLPCIPFAERLAVVEAIKGVDRAVPVTFENTGKMDSWRLYHFDCQFSGSDYENVENWMEDKKRLEAVGSTIEFLPYTNTTSSTKINNLILGRLAGKSLFVFGAGTYGRNFLRWYQNRDLQGKWNLLGFLDNNPQKNLTLLERNIIYTPEYLKSLENYQEITIVIAVKHKNEIVAQLHDMGMKNVVTDMEFQAKTDEEST